jgi:RNA polymerase sigma factor (sigma-70 family)
MNWFEFNEMIKAVRRMLVARFRNTATACIDDAVAEAGYRFVRTFGDMPEAAMPRGAAAQAWLTTTAVRLVAREWRRTRHLVSLHACSANNEGNVDEAGPAESPVSELGISCPDDFAHRLEVGQELEVLLRRLSPLLRTVVTLHDIQGIPLKIIAKHLGCSAATVRQRHIRALRQLREICRECHGMRCRHAADSPS